MNLIKNSQHATLETDFFRFENKKIKRNLRFENKKKSFLINF